MEIGEWELITSLIKLRNWGMLQQTKFNFFMKTIEDLVELVAYTIVCETFS